MDNNQQLPVAGGVQGTGAGGALTREDTGKLTRDQMVQKILRDIFRIEWGKPQSKRIIQLSVPAREITLAHVIGASEEEVYRNLGLTIGFHKGADLSGRSIGIIHITPAECAVIASDLAVKTADVDIGFMDRFKGTMIITGARAEVDAAIYEIARFFKDEMHYTVCPVTRQ